jgi:hypothetical protein
VKLHLLSNFAIIILNFKNLLNVGIPTVYPFNFGDVKSPKYSHLKKKEKEKKKKKKRKEKKKKKNINPRLAGGLVTHGHDRAMSHVTHSQGHMTHNHRTSRFFTPFLFYFFNKK